MPGLGYPPARGPDWGDRSVHYLKTRDLAQLRGFARDLTAALEQAGFVCSDGHQQAPASRFLKLVGRI